MIGIIVPKGDDTLFGTLICQKDKDFNIYVPAADPVAEAYEGQLPIHRGGLNDVQEPYAWILESGALPDQDFIRRAHRTMGRHPEFSVYHANLPETEAFPRVLKGEKLFRKLVIEQMPAPLSSFVFETARLKEKAVFRADGTLEPFGTILATGAATGVRNIWHQQLVWNAPALSADPVSLEKQVRERLDFLHWSESFYGENYPVGTGDRLELIAIELAKLFPSYSEEALKEMLYSFQAASGAVRKLRASSALKRALKARQQELK
ncbi:MAG: hypothetical protein IJ651_08910 [Bacteroidales bacterium]|nr:hypothetical protein [Bacteroidales bacterium]